MISWTRIQAPRLRNTEFSLGVHLYSDFDHPHFHGANGRTSFFYRCSGCSSETNHKFLSCLVVVVGGRPELEASTSERQRVSQLA